MWHTRVGSNLKAVIGTSATSVLLHNMTSDIESNINFKQTPFHNYNTDIKILVNMSTPQRILEDFVSIEMAFHSKALELYTFCYQSLQLVNEEEDLEVGQRSPGMSSHHLCLGAMQLSIGSLLCLLVYLQYFYGIIFKSLKCSTLTSKRKICHLFKASVLTVDILQAKL